MVKLIKYKLIILMSFAIIFFTTGCSPVGSLQKKEGIEDHQIPTPTSSLSSPNASQATPSSKTLNNTDSIIGSYNSELLDASPDRVKNINLAITKVSGYILPPGEIFSFNSVVGKRTTRKGYKKAKVLIDGEIEEGVGGGICQLSSTLYNAAEKAALEIVERHPHGTKVSYVPEGHDATVSYGTLDFKFKNTKNYPIEIKAEIKNNKVYVSILKGS